MPSLGTIDLSSFCDCPDPCPDCCWCGCGLSGLPDTLTATFHDTSGGACGPLDGATRTLTKGSSGGSTVWDHPASDPFPVQLYCNSFDGKIHLFISGISINDATVDAGFVCSPPHFHFTGLADGGCTFDVTVTA